MRSIRLMHARTTPIDSFSRIFVGRKCLQAENARNIFRGMNTETDLPPIVPKDADAEHCSRYAISPLTGFPIVKARPGQPRVTSEQIREWLADFP